MLIYFVIFPFLGISLSIPVSSKYPIKFYLIFRKGPAQAWVSTDIFYDGLRRKIRSDTRVTLAQYSIILAVHSVHFQNFLRRIYAAE